MRIVFLSFLVSFNALATNWSELSIGKSYNLSRAFQLPQVERSGSYLDFIKGEGLILNDIVPISISDTKMMRFVFDYSDCPGREMETGMKIIPINGSTPLVEVGVYVEKCELNLYIETKDYYNKSLFE